jgi:BA14K-like protein
MLRKISFALVAATTLATAALAPTSASAAWFWHDGWRGYHDYAWGWPFYASGHTYREAVAYCARHYRSYDAVSSTFVGNDGLRHACP